MGKNICINTLKSSEHNQRQEPLLTKFICHDVFSYELLIVLVDDILDFLQCNEHCVLCVY